MPKLEEIRKRLLPILLLASLIAAPESIAQFMGADGGAGGNVVSGSFGYTLPSKLREGGPPLGDVDTLHYRLAYVANVKVNEEWSWQAGVDYQQFSYSLPDNAPLPNTLRSVGVPLGVTWRLDERWLLRGMLHPGIYSDFEDISGDDVFLPINFGATYSFSRELQVLGGLAIEYRRDIPVFPYAGVRWQFAEDWTMLILFPRPGIEYRPWKGTTLFAGMSLRGGAFQVNEHFGDKLGRPELNNEPLTYWEIRAGAGVRYELLKGLSAEMDGGWMFDRRFVYKERDITIRSEDAPYIQTGLRFAF